MSLEKENKELREKLAYYENSPAAEFYKALVDGVANLTKAIKDRSLNFDESPYQKSLFQLAKEADKIMIALGKGMSVILPEAPKEDKRLKNSQSRAI